MGHCSSYEDEEAVDTSIAREMIVQSNNHLGVITPSNISPGAFVQSAADNNDTTEEALDGKHTTHLTTVVLYQKWQFGPKQKRILCGDHSKKTEYIRNTCVVPNNAQLSYIR